MIYFDSAATTYYRPPCVKEAVMEAIDTFGNPSRGAHGASLASDRCLFETRLLLCDLFHGHGPECVAFAMNATHALNTAIMGVNLERGGHLVVSLQEHNSVLRPSYRIRDGQVDLRFVELSESGVFDPDSLRRILRSIRCEDPSGKIVCAFSHGSNVTGNVIPLRTITHLCREYEAILILDAAQTAGIIPIDMKEDDVDILCFSGHKALMGPQGTGAIIVREGLRLRELLTGGSGVQTFLDRMPEQMPAHLEAGTQNAHSIAGLKAALEYAKGKRTDWARKEERDRQYLLSGLRKLEKKCAVDIYGEPEQNIHLPTVAFNIGSLYAGEVADKLWLDREVAVRAGGHCAPLLHKFFGTQKRGIVRVSISHENTREQIDILLSELEKQVSS